MWGSENFSTAIVEEFSGKNYPQIIFPQSTQPVEKILAAKSLLKTGLRQKIHPLPFLSRQERNRKKAAGQGPDPMRDGLRKSSQPVSSVTLSGAPFQASNHGRGGTENAVTERGYLVFHTIMKTCGKVKKLPKISSLRSEIKVNTVSFCCQLY